MVGTAGLLIAPAAQHRLVEKGEATARIIGVTTFHMEIALVVLAIGIALDLYVAFERIHGFATSLALAAATFLVATICWYALALFFRAPNRKQEHAVSKTKSPTPYSKKSTTC
jgi:uncharacterized membrane protein